MTKLQLDYDGLDGSIPPELGSLEKLMTREPLESYAASLPSGKGDLRGAVVSPCGEAVFPE